MFEGQNKIELSSEELDIRFDSLIETLPKELAKRWRDEYDEMPETTAELVARLEQFCQDRIMALDSYLEVEEGLDERIRAEILAIQRIIVQTFGKSEYFLGNGYTAEVYILPPAPGICVKYIHNQQAYNENNHLRTEYGFLHDLNGFAYDGIRTPVPYFLRIHPSEGHTYGMEKINGASLSQILENPEKHENLINLVRKMDKDQVLGFFVSYIKMLHEKFKLTHGDLLMRNLMLDEGGNFYVIDFGKAKFEDLGEDDERRRSVDIATLRSEIPKFFLAVDKI